MCLDILHAAIADAEPNNYKVVVSATPVQIVPPNDRRVALMFSTVSGDPAVSVEIASKDIANIPFGRLIGTAQGIASVWDMTVLQYGGIVRQEWWGSAQVGDRAIMVIEAIANFDYMDILRRLIDDKRREI